MIRVYLKYTCPCAEKEVLTVSHTISEEIGEAGFIRAMRDIWRKTLHEIHHHAQEEKT